VNEISQRIAKALRPPPVDKRASLTLPQRWLLLVGSCAYFGFLPASGTLSVAILGVPVFLLLSNLPAWGYGAFLVVWTLTAVAIHSAGDRLLGEKDSGKLVWDELAGFWLAMAFAPAIAWPVVLLGFLFERGLDILKPFPAGLIERRVPGGWGVVGDDLVAGVYAGALLRIVCAVRPGWVGL